ncbi:uncharacterized protein MONOS_10753 [Monocercomonoides exilis]|uniref:uncharacterized protein n=1 Tax=Monocercomonoides exilis TaxID=2049356 RepID=UPI00355ACB62|nr:hypothetical protein MONOS_10753 [Monocercomonoides exilis]|eukprot:MONOS_10753.1-p1 / transcript=MONOS_10753.1 / gene=MONOS_10753 / organism=Monocercomonoides_exilis_PA203 / gene_product=unspecified product / transcript_product=unspecified product / location=Mono_scaffold00502:18784-20659(+) / protein_length=501 / sequence_SO=supercontig / SO=protein_coding / is_pseudo=false
MTLYFDIDLNTQKILRSADPDQQAKLVDKYMELYPSLEKDIIENVLQANFFEEEKANEAFEKLFSTSSSFIQKEKELEKEPEKEPEKQNSLYSFPEISNHKFADYPQYSSFYFPHPSCQSSSTMSETYGGLGFSYSPFCSITQTKYNFDNLKGEKTKEPSKTFSDIKGKESEEESKEKIAEHTVDEEKVFTWIQEYFEEKEWVQVEIASRSKYPSLPDRSSYSFSPSSQYRSKMMQSSFSSFNFLASMKDRSSIVSSMASGRSIATPSMASSSAYPSLFPSDVDAKLCRLSRLRLWDVLNLPQISGSFLATLIEKDLLAWKDHLSKAKEIVKEAKRKLVEEEAKEVSVEMAMAQEEEDNIQSEMMATWKKLFENSVGEVFLENQKTKSTKTGAKPFSMTIDLKGLKVFDAFLIVKCIIVALCSPNSNLTQEMIDGLPNVLHFVVGNFVTSKQNKNMMDVLKLVLMEHHIPHEFGSDGFFSIYPLHQYIQISLQSAKSYYA